MPYIEVYKSSNIVVFVSEVLTLDNTWYHFVVLELIREENEFVFGISASMNLQAFSEEIQEIPILDSTVKGAR